MRRGGDRHDRYDNHRRSRSRSRERANHREDREDRRWKRDKNHSGYNGPGHEREERASWQEKEQRHQDSPSSPTNTVIIRGLLPNTTEPADNGECKGFAFVEFYTVEHAMYFLSAYAGSTGSAHGTQFFVNNMPVTLDYAKEQQHKPARQETSGAGRVKTDWLCELCGCQNFSRREACYRCAAPRTASSIEVQTDVRDPFSETQMISVSPTPVLLVKGLQAYVSQDQVSELFRQFAIVKSVHLLTDPISGIFRGLALVEFHSTEYATHTLNHSSYLQAEHQLKIYYAKESALRSYRPAVNPYAAAALQAAQWSQTSYAPPVAKVAASSTLKQKAQYPMDFETYGASYIFQPKTGVFYDPNTLFFYCPKSKLYYDEINGIYLQHTPLTDPPFTAFHPPLPLEPCAAPETVPAAELPQVHKPVVMSFGTKHSKKKESALLAPAVIITPAKKANEDINKWSERQQEVASLQKPETVRSCSPNEVKKETASDKPVCMLCRRQFASHDMLLRHERESKLHAENLAKANASNYRDRASERRAKYGQPTEVEDLTVRAKHHRRSRSRERAPPPLPVQSNEEVAVYADETNVGNTLLRKYGWKDGEGLGKEGSGLRDPVAVDKAAQDGRSKIGIGAGPPIPHIEYGSGFKDSVMKAARARFEQLEKESRSS